MFYDVADKLNIDKQDVTVYAMNNIEFWRKYLEMTDEYGEDPKPIQWLIDNWSTDLIEDIY
jgi:hypothetical protein